MRHRKPMILRPTLKALAASRRVAERRLANLPATTKQTSPEMIAIRKRIEGIDAAIAKVTTLKAP